MKVVVMFALAIYQYRTHERFLEPFPPLGRYRLCYFDIRVYCTEEVAICCC